MEWDWQGKTLSQCHFVDHKFHMDWTRDRNRASAVKGRRLSAWAMARPQPSVSYMSRISSVCVVTRLRMEIPGFEARQRAKYLFFLQNVQNGSEARPPSHSMATVFCLGGKESGIRYWPQPPSSVDVKNGWNYISTPLLYVHGVNMDRSNFYL